MSIDIDQATHERWLADGGRWVQFAEGLSHPNHNRESGVELNVAPWAQECETCGGYKVVKRPNVKVPRPCPDCKDGNQRLPVTVPCPSCGGSSMVPSGNCWPGWRPCPNCNTGRITVNWATVEWAALVSRTHVEGHLHVVELWTHDGTQWFVCDCDALCDPITLPPGVNPASLVDQWARGGTLEFLTNIWPQRASLPV